MSAPEILLFSNQKGGVGKTTLCRELGVYVASLGHAVLLVDCDAQGNLTKSLVEDGATDVGGSTRLTTGLYDAIAGNCINLHQVSGTLAILCGDVRLSSLEKSLVGEIDGYLRLKELLSSEHFQKFAYIFLDTPPSLGMLTLNAMCAARHLVVPMRPSLYSMQGTNDLLSALAKVKKSMNPGLNLLGVVINGFESVPVITREIRGEIEEAFKEHVFGTVLSETVKIEEAIAKRQGVIHMAKLDKSRAREEVMAIGNELLARLAGVHHG